jgi:orotate phosphoribosyltransferase
LGTKLGHIEPDLTLAGSGLEAVAAQVITAVEALREAAAEVKAVAVIVDRAAGAQAKTEELGLP